MSPEVLPPDAQVVRDSDALALVQDVYDLTIEQVMTAIERGWGSMRLDAWRFSFMLQRAWVERGWEKPRLVDGEARTYKSFTAWADDVFGVGSAVASKWRAGAEYTLALPEPDRIRVMAAAWPQTLGEAGIPRLAQKDPVEAKRLAASGMPSRKLTQAVRTRLADEQHYDVEELKTFKRLVSAPAYARLLAMWNVTKFLCQSPRPTDSEIAELMAFEYLSGVQIEPEILAHFPLEDIEKGKVRCIECGLTSPQMLEGHHVIPKSHGGHDGPQVWLCRDQHREVTENVDGTWRQRLFGWMARKDLAWLVEDVNAFLAGRRLEEL